MATLVVQKWHTSPLISLFLAVVWAVATERPADRGEPLRILILDPSPLTEDCGGVLLAYLSLSLRGTADVCMCVFVCLWVCVSVELWLTHSSAYRNTQILFPLHRSRAEHCETLRPVSHTHASHYNWRLHRSLRVSVWDTAVVVVQGSE